MESRGRVQSLQRNIALLGALSLFLGTIEYLIPKPLPFMRLGLANLPILLALDLMSPWACLLVAVIKVLGQAFISGTLFSYIFLFSLGGTSASVLIMLSLRSLLRTGRLSFVGMGITGAISSNVMQMVLARIFIFGPSVVYAAPPFLTMGLITGAALGIFCEVFRSKSQWYRIYHESCS